MSDVRDMFVIAFDGDKDAQVTARIASDALIMAEDLAEQGWAEVRITTPDGETYPVKAFARRLREGLI